jgi:AAA+ superfamily predicted ATPase
VFIFETSDLKRVRQFIQFILNTSDFINHKKYHFDLQLQEIKNVETGEPVVLEEQSFLGPIVPTASVNLRKLLTNLRLSPIILIITYAYDAKHSSYLQEFLVSVSHDDQIYGLKSTVTVFTSDASLFNHVVRRLAYTITIPPSLPNEREEVLRRIKGELEERFGKQLDLNISPDVINTSSGLNLYDIETAAIESFSRYGDFRVEVFTEYKVKLLREVGLEYIQPVRGFESVGGYDYLKRYITNRVIKVLRNPDVAQKYGLSIPKGILLYGPPGTGKTWFARALAKEVGLPMVVIDSSTFLRGIVGETEMRIKYITYLIESLSPIIVFIDEFDQLALGRQSMISTDSGVSRRMVNMLLSWLGDENRKSFVVGATNFLSDIDQAFLRSGRLDEIIPVFYPDREARLQILNIHTSIIRRVPLRDVNLPEIVKLTHMWTGAELERLILEASSLAMIEGSEYVTQQHFDHALKAVDVNVSEREEKLQRMVEELKKLENVNLTLINSALQFWLREKGVEGERIRGVMA